MILLPSSQGRDGNVKTWQLVASLTSIKQQETQINTGAFSFCRCAVASMEARASPLPVCAFRLTLCSPPVCCVAGHFPGAVL